MAFELLVGLDVKDQSYYAKYRQGMTPILHSYGGSFRYDFTVEQTIAGAAKHPINRLFLISFPNRASRESFFKDPNYLKIRGEFFEAAVGARTTISEYEI